jgi:hypothetical protein
VAIPVATRLVRGYQDTDTALIVSVGDDMSAYEHIPAVQTCGQDGPFIAEAVEELAAEVVFSVRF